MPDHVHGIVVIAASDAHNARDAGDGGDARHAGDAVGELADCRVHLAAAAPLRHTPDGWAIGAAMPPDPPEGWAIGALLARCRPRGIGVNVAAGSLGAIVRSYKAAVARRTGRLLRAPGASLWQRGYYERIIRAAAAMAAIRAYIAENPARHAARSARIDGERGRRKK